MTEINVSKWEEIYRSQRPEEMPWYNPELDHDFLRAIREYQIKGGKVLDAGTGPGTQAFGLAKLGFDVTATDISETAVNQAREKAAQNNLKIKFFQDDILKTKLTDRFDYVFDRGLFHVMEPAKRHIYVKTVSKLIKPGGFLFLKCFSNKQPGTEGPYRLAPEDITENFSNNFEVLSIVDTIFEVNRKPSPKALFCVLRLFR